MEIIAKSSSNNFLAKLTTQEIDFLAGKQVGKGIGGYYSNEDRSIPSGTKFDIIKAFTQIHRNDQRKNEIITVRKTLEGVINSLDIIEPYIEEPKDAESVVEVTA